jgi:hypothetical protein
MTLDPERYECPDHHVNLTDRVKEKLDPDRPDVAFGGPFGRRQDRGPHQFKVTVTCPGADGAEAHLLTCTGTKTP